MPMHRIVCLTPSATELVCALGFDEDLVGLSHECGDTGAPEGLPSCTLPLSEPPPAADAMDARLRVLPETSWRVDWEHVEALEPTHIFAHGDWRTRAAVKDMPDRLRERFVSTTRCTHIAEVWRAALDVAEALNAQELGIELVASLQSRMAAIVNQALPLLSRPRVLLLEWLEPPLAAGAYIPEIVEMGGGKNLLCRPGEDNHIAEIDMLRALAPEVMLIVGRNMSMQRAREDIQALTNTPEWWDLPATRQEQVFVVDGVRYFHRPGPRLVESLEIVAEILHPDEFQFGHEGEAWQVL